MRSSRFGMLVCLCLFGFTVKAQQTSTTTTSQQTQAATSVPSATKDTQAVAILNQALAVAGGAAAISAVSDYTGTGNVTYPSEQGAQGTVTVQGFKGTEFRMDAILPAGTRSMAVANGVT